MVGSSRKVFAIAIDNSGNIVWQKMYDLSGKNLSGRIFVANNGDLLMLSYELGNSTNGNIHLFRIEAATGWVLWAKEYVHPGFDAVNILEEKSNGNLMIYGYTSSYGSGQRDFLLMETTSTGDVQNCNTAPIVSNIAINTYSPTVQNITPSTGSTLTNSSLNLASATINVVETVVCEGVTADFALSNNTICVGDCINITDQSINANQWQWTFTGTNPNSSTQQNVNQVCYNNAGTFNIQLIASDGSSSDTMIQTITVTNPPIVNLGQDTSICNGQTVTLDATTPNASYLWSDNSTNSTLSVSTTGLYSVTVTIGNCSSSDDINIMVENNPIVNLGADTTFCDAVDFILNATAQNVTYTWQDNSSQPTYTAFSSGNYSVTITDMMTNCTSSDDIMLTFNQSPIIQLIEDTVICEHQFIMLDVTIPNGTYLWNDGSMQSTLNVTNSGLYTVAVTVDNCTSMDTVEIIVKPTPAIDLGEDEIPCIGNIITLDAFDENAIDYSWNIGSTDSMINISNSGTYSVYINYQNGCFNTDTINFLPELDVTLNFPPDTSICINSAIELNAYHPNAQSYQWEGASVYYGQNDLSDSVFIVTYPGEYTITLNNGCRDISQIINITKIDCGCYPFIPNAFTPNADGQNDEFKVYSNCPLENYELMIFEYIHEI